MDISELIHKLSKGEIKLYEVENFVQDVNKAAEVRRAFLERITGSTLKNIGYFSMDLNVTAKRNIESPVGVGQIPMGVAGPLRVKGDYANGLFYIPLCTTEGALVASVNRGCSAITESGGANAKVVRDYMTRAPLFITPSAEHAFRLTQWVKEHKKEIEEVFNTVDPFVRFIDVQPWIVGRNVWLRFMANTFDAMGMNGVTLACDKACKFIEETVKFARMISLSGNLCVDKKPSAVNWLLGRGKTVVAEATLKREVVADKLKTTPEDVVDVCIRKNMLGSGLAHAYGLNAHAANVIAAIFIATGQDCAQVVESSMALTTAEVNAEGELYISITLPSLEVGTVGGGTALPTQREALTIMGCAGAGDPPGANAKKFAEIVASACLAGELSLLSALAAGHLAKAHARLGRASRI
ncbi:MAG: hydroxymethylglutaryl-CoA reductase (NADPH) [Candidatus Nezhaarchaeota archaeon]|nr:hydroxymethylglutaryl-CoA reductase (NADPH) [Candidatus Nezhaarchaeota archaeon]